MKGLEAWGEILEEWVQDKMYGRTFLSQGQFTLNLHTISRKVTLVRVQYNKLTKKTCAVIAFNVNQAGFKMCDKKH